MTTSTLEKLPELLGLLSQNLADAKASLRAYRAYRSGNLEGQQFTSQLLDGAAKQLAQHAQQLTARTGELVGSINGTVSQSSKTTAATQTSVTSDNSRKD